MAVLDELNLNQHFLALAHSLFLHDMKKKNLSLSFFLKFFIRLVTCDVVRQYALISCVFILNMGRPIK